MKKKGFVILVFLAGLSGLFWGMIRENNALFILGLILVIGGYIRIRKRLKASIRDME